MNQMLKVANLSQILRIARKSQNLTRDFSLTLFAQNDKTMDCHDLTSSNLAMTENDADSVNRRISHEIAESKS
ncbi:hypothetical protein ACWIUD_07100 [Helicobacter sp. 23-1044]